MSTLCFGFVHRQEFLGLSFGRANRPVAVTLPPGRAVFHIKSARKKGANHFSPRTSNPVYNTHVTAERGLLWPLAR
jgi:hypothetical protein